MEAFPFTDVLDDGPPRDVVARVMVRSREHGGRDLRGGVVFRPNHNFEDERNRAFYIGQVEVPPEGIRAGEAGTVRVRFLSGPGLAEFLHVGRHWRIQEGPQWIASAEILEVTA